MSATLPKKIEDHIEPVLVRMGLALVQGTYYRERNGRVLRLLIEREDADLVMLSAHGGSGDARRLYGSMAMSFIVHGMTPLLIAQDMERSELEPTSAEMAATQDKGH